MAAGGGIKINNVKINGGADGATFTPMVDAEGNLSWSNNKGYTNPATVNIKGLKGDKGEKGDKGLQGAQGIQGATGADGKTPVKGVDYFTEADKLEIAQTVEENAKGDIVQSIIEELQGLPVFGVVDENNIIKVTSQLSDGTYILKYENEDGTLEVIGTITVGNGEVIEYTNLVDTTLTTDTTITLSSIGWLPNVRINSSNAVVPADGNHITNIIPVGNKNVLRIKNMDIYGGYGRIYLYNGTTFVYAIIPSTNVDSFTALGDEYSEVTIAKLQAILSKNASDKTFDSVRIGGTLIGTKEDVIVTLDEEIT